MGLDQYILKKIEDDEYEYEQLIQWRKRNQIHAYFDKLFDGVENCEMYCVTIDQLKELSDICQKVLDNHDLAEELLPHMGGIFFGNYDYEDFYFKQVQESKEDIDELIENDDGKTQYYYYGWW